MKLPVLCAGAVALAACSTNPKPAPTADTQPAAAQQTSPAQQAPEAQPAKDPAAELAAVEKDLLDAGTTGTHAGTLFEKKGDLLAAAGKKDEAIAAYEAAARAYGQSPEATTMPVVRSDRAREKAAKLRGAR